MQILDGFYAVYVNSYRSYAKFMQNSTRFIASLRRILVDFMQFMQEKICKYAKFMQNLSFYGGSIISMNMKKEETYAAGTC